MCLPEGVPTRTPRETLKKTTLICQNLKAQTDGPYRITARINGWSLFNNYNPPPVKEKEQGNVTIEVRSVQSEPIHPCTSPSNVKRILCGLTMVPEVATLMLNKTSYPFTEKG